MGGLRLALVSRVLQPFCFSIYASFGDSRGISLVGFARFNLGLMLKNPIMEIKKIN